MELPEPSRFHAVPVRSRHDRWIADDQRLVGRLSRARALRSELSELWTALAPPLPDAAESHTRVGL